MIRNQKVSLGTTAHRHGAEFLRSYSGGFRMSSLGQQAAVSTTAGSSAAEIVMTMKPNNSGQVFCRMLASNLRNAKHANAQLTRKRSKPIHAVNPCSILPLQVSMTQRTNVYPIKSRSFSLSSYLEVSRAQEFQGHLRRPTPPTLPSSFYPPFQSPSRAHSIGHSS